MDSNFWGIYWPVLAALFTWVVTLEIIGFTIRHYAYKKQLQRVKEVEAKISSGQMPVVPLFDPMMDPMGLYSSYQQRRPVASGETGQYL